MTTRKIPDEVQGLERIPVMQKAVESRLEMKDEGGNPDHCYFCRARPSHCVRPRGVTLAVFMCGHCFDAIEAFMDESTHEYIHREDWPASA